MNYIDISISIFQNVLFVYTINNCLEAKIMKDIKKVAICTLLLSSIAFIFPSILGNNSVCIFLMHIFGMFIVSLFFKKKYFQALIAWSLIYSIVAIWIFTFGNILYGFLAQIVAEEYMTILSILLMYISQVILLALCFKFADKIKQVYKLIITEKYSINYILTISFIPDFLISLYLISYKIDSVILKEIVVIALFVFVVLNAIYFRKIKKRANEIFKLYKVLDMKNSELKKVKNNYGLQILHLYELCLAEKFDDIKSSLKSTINTIQNNTSTDEKSKVGESLLSLATKHAKCDDVNIIVEDKANFKLTTMTEMELYRIIVNIVNNAIKAMKNKGTLIAKSYEDSNNIVIEIGNNGEKIPEEFLDKIFDSGFTTKENSDRNHGYGLSIVKELIENNNGKISVDSSEIKTQFTITLPIKR